MFKSKQKYYFLILGFLLSPLLPFNLRAAWTEPTLAPTGGNVPAPIYSEGTDQSMIGTVNVNLPTDGLSTYGLRVLGTDGTPPTAKWVGLGNNNVWFGQRISGIAFPHYNSDYGYVNALQIGAQGKTQIRSLGNGISFSSVVGVAPGTVTTWMTIAEAGNVGIGSTTPYAKLSLVANTNTEGIRVIASNYSPFIIRDTLDSNDLFRVNESGNLTISGTINDRSIGIGLGGIAINAGSGITNQGLDANYLEGHAWNDVVNLLAETNVITPEKHYFISATTTNGVAGGYKGLDQKCTEDANALPGRSYHAYAVDKTSLPVRIFNRGFIRGFIYSNDVYGTFVPKINQDPNFCSDLGISCDAKWLANGGGFWNTSTGWCSNFTSSSNSLQSGGSLYTGGGGNGIVSGTNIGILQASGGQANCATKYNILCVQDSISFTDPSSVCGNGTIEYGEYCDDGNTANDATCPSDCQANGGTCGDGYLASDEQCDYGKIVPNSYGSTYTYGDRGLCSSSCLWTSDQDGDGYSGQNDCWNRTTNNDNLAYPGSTNKSENVIKDMNCDSQINQELNVCTAWTSVEKNTYVLNCSFATLNQACQLEGWTAFGNSCHTDSTYGTCAYCNTTVNKYW